MRETKIANWQKINSQLANRKQPTSACVASRLFYWNSYLKRFILFSYKLPAKYSSLFTLCSEPPVFIGISKGEEYSGTLHPLFTTLHLQVYLAPILLAVYKSVKTEWWRVVKSGWRDEKNSSPLGMPINTGVPGRKVKSEEYFDDSFVFFNCRHDFYVVSLFWNVKMIGALSVVLLFQIKCNMVARDGSIGESQFDVLHHQHLAGEG